MKSVTHNIFTLLLLLCILIPYFYDYSEPTKIDFKKQIVDFTKLEDSRDINKVLGFFEFPVLDYWENKGFGKSELKKLYLSYWKGFEYSKNEIQKIEKVSDYEFVLTTKYVFRKNIASKVNRYRLSETKFKFNVSGKVTSIINLSLKRIDGQYIIDNNLISNFSVKENIPQKNNLQLTSFFIVLLMLNLSVQIVGGINKRKRINNKVNESKRESEIDKESLLKNDKVKSNQKPQEKVRKINIEQQKLSDERELHRLIELEKAETKRERDLREKKAAEVKANHEFFTRLTKETIEREKVWKERAERVRADRVKISAQEKEAASIKRNKLAREKREEQKRLELVQKVREEARVKREKIAAQEKEAARIKRNKLAREKREEQKKLEQIQKVKEEARIKREKLVIKKREESERAKREKEELDDYERRQQELVKPNPESIDQSKDDFFDNNLSQFITEIPDDEDDQDESDIGEFLTDKYMSKNLKKKFKKK